MKSILTFIICWAIALCPVWGQGILSLAGSPQLAAGGTLYTYLVKQDFEGTGYDNGETWTPTGSPDPDYATSLEGTQSMRIATSAANSHSTRSSFGDTEFITLFFRLKVATFGPAAYNLIGGRTAASSSVWGINWGSGNALRVQHGSVISSAGTTTIVAGTEYYVWVEYAPSTGANGVIKSFISTTPTKPGTADATVTNGDATGHTGIIRIGHNASITQDFVIDHLRVVSGPANTVTDYPL